jgi:hypothetical protein
MSSFLLSSSPFHRSQFPPKAKRRSSESETAHGLLSLLFSSSLVSASHSKKKLAGMRQRRCFHGSRQAPLLSSLSERALMELKFAFGVFDQ